MFFFNGYYAVPLVEQCEGMLTGGMGVGGVGGLSDYFLLGPEKVVSGPYSVCIMRLRSH